MVNSGGRGSANRPEVADGDLRVLVRITMPISQHVIGCLGIPAVA